MVPARAARRSGAESLEGVNRRDPLERCVVKAALAQEGLFIRPSPSASAGARSSYFHMLCYRLTGIANCGCSTELGGTSGDGCVAPRHLTIWTPPLLRETRRHGCAGGALERAPRRKGHSLGAVASTSAYASRMASRTRFNAVVSPIARKKICAARQKWTTSALDR